MQQKKDCEAEMETASVPKTATSKRLILERMTLEHLMSLLLVLNMNSTYLLTAMCLVTEQFFQWSVSQGIKPS